MGGESVIRSPLAACHSAWMSWETGSKIALSALPVLAALMALFRGRGGRYTRVKQNAELLALLPEGSAARNRLLKYLDDSITALAREEESQRRDPFGTGLAVVFLIGAAITLIFAIDGSGWWWVATATLLVFGVAGLAESATMSERDDRGRRIKPSKTDTADRT